MQTPRNENVLTYEEAKKRYEQMLQKDVARTKKNIPGFIIAGVVSFAVGSFFQHMAGTSMFSMHTYTDSLIWGMLSTPAFWLAWIATVGCLAVAVYGVYDALQKSKKGFTFDDVKTLRDTAKEYPDEAERFLKEADELEAVLNALGKK